MSRVNEIVGRRLGHLLKHAQQQLFELTNAALEPYDLVGRELPVLLLVGDGEPSSQLELANQLGIDRTTMVAMLNVLQDKGLVQRTAHGTDRRRNVVELTSRGHDTVARACAAADAAERRFLAALDDADVDWLRRTLRAVVEANAEVPSRSEQ